MRLLKWILYLAAFVFVLAAGALVFAFYPRHPLPKEEPVSEIVYLDQGWGATADSKDRQIYYFTPQGTNIKGLRYEWFAHLEQPRNRMKFAAPENLRAFGFLVDMAPTAANPYQLPVGFAHHYDPDLREEMLDITCAACHTGQFNVTKGGKTVAVRVDGGEARHAFTALDLGHFIPELILSLTETYIDPFAFDRFAKAVLGDSGSEGKSRLHKELEQVIEAFAKQGWIDKSKHLYPVEEGFGRTDAIGRIANTVFGDHVPKANNYRVGDAPVSFPPVWDIWKFDWVQYGASVQHPLARNIGEGLGVGTKFDFFDPYGRPVPAAKRYLASTMLDNLTVIEATLQRLQPPKWPEELLGNIDCNKAAAGKQLFEQHCIGCHGPIPGTKAQIAWDAPGKLERDARMKRNDEAFGLTHLSQPPLPHWIMQVSPVGVIGTDPKAAENFVNRRFDLSSIGLTDQEVRSMLKPLWVEGQARRNQPTMSPADIEKALNQIDLRSVSTGSGLNVLSFLIRKQYRADARFRAVERGETLTDAEGVDDDLFFGEIDLLQAPLGYKARPLAGIWATAPYLHNGSVPTLYQMLVPVAQRDAKFFVGRKEYDPVHVGYVLQPLSDNGFWLDATVPGNSNKGHEFNAAYTGKPEHGVIGPLLTDPERYALIEYLKIRQDSPGVAEFPARCGR
jgi:hypothetical protein